MRGSLAICVLWVASGCGDKQTVIGPSSPDPFVFDVDSDAKLTQLMPQLAEGRYVYGVSFMLPEGEVTSVADVERVTIAPHAGGWRVAVDAMTVETDLQGGFVGSEDGTGSAETVQRLTLRAGSLDPAEIWTRAPGTPLYTQAELSDLDASGVTKTKTVVDHSRALGLRALPDGTHVVAIKRALRSYVVPSEVALRDGPARAAAGFTLERPGMNEQRGVAYAFLAVLPSSEAVLLLEAAILFPRLGAIPDSLDPYANRSTPAIAWIRQLDVTAAGLPSSLRPTVERALVSLPASARELYLDRSRGGGIVIETCVHCGGV